MKKIGNLFAAALLILMMGCSGSNDPQSQLSVINEKLSKKFPMTAEQAELVDTHVAEGKRLLEEGKTEESSQAFAQALEILERAEDVYIFNKAD
ncbi:MAG: hypothetical protein JSU90_01690 [Nitrospiraceae bacterium]|nr:MAG: hypothetical protein JSU90_01690 [Nitrospiraceae bacterium]